MGPELTSHKGSNVVPKPTVQHLRVCNKFDCSVIVAIWVAWLVFDILKATFFSPKNPECPWTSPIPILPLHPGMWFFPWLVYCAIPFSFSNLQIIVPKIIFKQVFCKTRFFFVQKNPKISFKMIFNCLRVSCSRPGVNEPQEVSREKCAALCDGWLSGWCLDGPNRQSLAFSERGQLSQAIRQLDMTANKR